MKAKHTIIDDIGTQQLRYGTGTFKECPKNDKTRMEEEKKGRPRLSWREGINQEMRDREFEENLWTDRQRWQVGIVRRRRTF